jgi:hypothetical protein
MKAFALCLALAVLPAFGADRVVPIRLYTAFEQPPPEPVLDSLQEEMESIMRPLGLDLNWRSLADNNGSEVSVQLAVIHFRGSCDTVDLKPFAEHPGALGWTHMTDGVILPFSDIDCNRVRVFVQRDLLAFPREERQPAFGRAIARVLAHELYHIFANTTRHGSWGVAKASYSVQELLAGSFLFEKKECDKLRNYSSHLAATVGATGN